MKQKNNSGTFSSEEALVSYFRQRVPRYGATTGIGDDAAIISTDGKPIVLTTDSLVEDVHFQRDWVTPLYLGKKAARTNLSDIAAMGASPTHALVSLVLPQDWWRTSVISALYDGLLWAFAPHQVEIIGGNVSSGELINITVTLLGKLDGKPLLRSGAGVGDIIFCTGILGGPAREVSQLTRKKKKRMEVVPPDRIVFAKELAKQRLSTACIDISDGLAIDLSRICSANSVGASVVESTLPLIGGNISREQRVKLALFGGEEYELLFTVLKEKVSAVEALAKNVHVDVRAIGGIEDGKEIVIVDRDGHRRVLESGGWDHIMQSIKK